jgi:hypothetical protein
MNFRKMGPRSSDHPLVDQRSWREAGLAPVHTAR